MCRSPVLSHRTVFKTGSGAVPITFPCFGVSRETQTPISHLRRVALYSVELGKHETKILHEHDQPIVGKNRRTLTGFSVKRLEQRRQQII